MNSLIIIFIIVLLCIFLACVFITKRINKTNKSIVQNIVTKAHYYMFTIDKIEYLIYVSSVNKMTDDAIHRTKLTILDKLNINDSEIINEIGVSYLGYISENEFKRQEL